jgi:integrase/recombinase XerC
MVEHRRAHQSPVAKLKMLNVGAGRMRERRALSTDDLLNLIRTTDKAPMYGSIAGKERATLYWMVAESGLRASGLRCLTASSFDADSSPPMVTIRAAYAKNRRQDTLALTDDLAARLRLHLATKLPATKAFMVPRRTADMLRKDLERAKIPYRDEAGFYYDFHSLRVRCASSLARGGAHPAVAQARLRLSSVRLTLDRYTRLGADEQTAALTAMPRLTLGA